MLLKSSVTDIYKVIIKIALLTLQKLSCVNLQFYRLIYPLDEN